MTQYQLTLDSETVQRLFGGNEQVARLLEQILNQVLEAQVAEHLQAEHLQAEHLQAEHLQAEHLQAEPYERSEDRRGYRNGYKPRQLTTRIGTRALRVPGPAPCACRDPRPARAAGARRLLFARALRALST